MATIRMTTQEARNYVKKNEKKLQVMYDVAPFAEEILYPDAKPVARGFVAFKENILAKKKQM